MWFAFVPDLRLTHLFIVIAVKLDWLKLSPDLNDGDDDDDDNNDNVDDEYDDDVNDINDINDTMKVMRFSSQ